jgi:glutathione S-transferase
MTMGDITIAPYMWRMCVLKHHRDFEIPEYIKEWHEWTKAVLSHPAVVKTLTSNHLIVSFYRRYANN